MNNSINNFDFLEDLYELEDEYSSIFMERLLSTNILKDIIHNNTATSLSSLINNIVSIKLGIIETAQSSNIYSTYILYRSYLEHYVKTLYIWIRHVESNSDLIGKEYLIFLSINEYLGLINKSIKVYQLNDFPKINKTDYQLILQCFPEFGIYSLKDINNITNQFKLYSMLKYIYRIPDSFIKKHELLPIKNYLDLLLPDYSLYSSFIHGGPNTIKHIAQFNDPNVLNIEIKRIIKVLFLSNIFLKTIVILFFCKHHSDFYKDLALQKEFTDKFYKIINEV